MVDKNLIESTSAGFYLDNAFSFVLLYSFSFFGGSWDDLKSSLMKIEYILYKALR